MDDEMIERVAIAIVKAANCNIFGKYDYSSYPGDAAPYQIKNNATRELLFATHNYDEAEEFYIKVCRDYIAKEAIKAMREPTSNMLDKADYLMFRDKCKSIWQSMINAIVGDE